jgi:hypothetical protein
MMLSFRWFLVCFILFLLSTINYIAAVDPVYVTQPSSRISYKTNDPDQLALLHPTLLNKYAAYRVLDEKLGFVLYWNIDSAKEQINLAIQANTHGWLGIGISAVGLMIQSDVYVGWVTDSQDSYNNTANLADPNLSMPAGVANVEDYFFGSRQLLCPIGICKDTAQKGSYDVMNVTGWQSSSGVTYVQFTRYLETGDSITDFDIKDGESYLIYAMAFDENDNLQYHTMTHRGQLQHYWYPDEIVNTLYSEKLIAGLITPVSIKDEAQASYTTFGSILALQCSLLYISFVSFYCIRFLRAYRIFAVLHSKFFLPFAHILYSLLILALLLRYANEVTLSEKYNRYATDIDKAHLGLSILWLIGLILNGLAGLISVQIQSIRVKHRVKLVMKQESVRAGPDSEFDPKMLLLEGVANFLHREIELPLTMMGITLVQLGLSSSFLNEESHNPSAIAAFWLITCYIVFCALVQHVLTVFLKLYINLKGEEAVRKNERTSQSASHSGEIAEAAKISAPVSHPYVLKVALLQFLGLIVATVLAIIVLSNAFRTNSPVTVTGSVIPAASQVSSSPPASASASSLSGYEPSDSSYSESYAEPANEHSVFPPIDANNKQFLRTYYVAADEVDWDYAPEGALVTAPLAADYDPLFPDAGTYINQTMSTMGSISRKAVYREYTDATFKHLKPIDDRDKHIGILGLIMRAQVGDTLEIFFKNHATRNYTMHPHGVFYNKGNEGYRYKDGATFTGGMLVQPGETWQYYFPVPLRSGPAANESTDSVIWFVHSHIDELGDFNAGLLCAIIVYKIGACDINRRSTTVDREFVLTSFHIDEMGSPYYNHNFLDWANATGRTDIAALKLLYHDVPLPAVGITPFVESNNRYTWNGYIYGNNYKAYTMYAGERVRFYLNMFGGTALQLMTTVVFQHHTVLKDMKRIDSVTLVPGEMLAVDMYPSQTGNFSVAAGFVGQERGGAITQFTVKPASEKPIVVSASSSPNPITNDANTNVAAASAARLSLSKAFEGAMVYYYIAADEYSHNYMPNGMLVDTNVNSITNPNWGTYPSVFGPEGDPSQLFPLKKARYNSYTNSTFLEKSPVQDRYKHLGAFGDIIRAEVGHTVKITFKNNLGYPVNMRPRGGIITYDSNKKIEDSSADFSSVAPGTVAVFYWYISEQSGPSIHQKEASIGWTYGSRTSDLLDQNTGLTGGIVVTLPGRSNLLNADGSISPLFGQTELIEYTIPDDVDYEYFLLWQIYDEERSHYFLSDNAANWIGNFGRASINHLNQGFGFPYAAVNGYMFANMPGVEMDVGNAVRWYFSALGDAADVHVPVIHGNSLYNNGRRQAYMVMTAGATETVDMIAANPGTYLIYCHSVLHAFAGQAIQYIVKENRPASQNSFNSGTKRIYYIAAEAVFWDYNPLGKNGILDRPYEGYEKFLTVGVDTNFKNAAGTPGTKRFGSQYWKPMYVEYTGPDFTQQKEVPAQYKHMGFQGPIIRGEVGDLFEIHFKNNIAQPDFDFINGGPVAINVNLMPHGGVDVLDEAHWLKRPVAPMETVIYTWFAGPQSGPGPADTSSVLHVYHSTVNPEAHTVAGLFGPIIIDRKNSTYIDKFGVTHPVGIENEVIVTFSTHAEVLSPLFFFTYSTAVPAFPPMFTPCDGHNWCDDRYMMVNFAGQPMNFSGNPFFMGPLTLFTLPLYSFFDYVFEAINGYVFGGNTGVNDIVVKEGANTRWYSYDTGTAQDMVDIQLRNSPN